MNDETITFTKDSSILVQAVALAMPNGPEWNPDDRHTKEYQFLTAGMEHILALAFDGAIEPDHQCACDADDGIWFCYFYYGDIECRVIIEHHETSEAKMYVQATMNEWDTCSNFIEFKTPGELGELVHEAIEGAKADYAERRG